ncbi:MAG: SMP-30/gluconolactonase/LRE family protein [Robiginitomaculum sp.]|nr:SMP-30/gluconolactonase/LRE family protein [Robiginitomaculum sp.]
MKIILYGSGLAVLALVAYLLLWPVPIKPVAWQAPTAPGYTGQWASNTRLAELHHINLGSHSGPEDVAAKTIDGIGYIFAAVHDGSILQIEPETGEIITFANTGGRPLGLEFDSVGNLIVADAMRGLLQISPVGVVRLLTDRVTGGSKIGYAEDLDIAADGRIFFTDASTRFSAKAWGDVLTASVWDLMEHSSNGRLLVFDPANEQTSVVKTGFNFANGVAMCPQDQCVFVADTGTYAVWRIWLDGNVGGQVDKVLTNLPGFPDNINRGTDGTYWVGLASPRLGAIDNLSDKPWVRKLIMRLPDPFKPAPLSYGMVINFGFDGHVLNQLQDPTNSYPTTTGALAADDGWLYITSLTANTLARKGWSKSEATRP